MEQLIKDMKLVNDWIESARKRNDTVAMANYANEMISVANMVITKALTLIPYKEN